MRATAGRGQKGPSPEGEGTPAGRLRPLPACRGGRGRSADRRGGRPRQWSRPAERRSTSGDQAPSGADAAAGFRGGASYTSTTAAEAPGRQQLGEGRCGRVSVGVARAVGVGAKRRRRATRTAVASLTAVVGESHVSAVASRFGRGVPAVERGGSPAPLCGFGLVVAIASRIVALCACGWEVCRPVLSATRGTRRRPGPLSWTLLSPVSLMAGRCHRAPLAGVAFALARGIGVGRDLLRSGGGRSGCPWQPGRLRLGGERG